MPPSEDAVRLRHMLDAAEKALAHMQDKSREDLDSDDLLSLAVVRLLEIIGEAAKSVTSATRDSHPDIPWRQIAGTRDRLIHGYFDVDFDIVWAIIQDDLPDLVSNLHQALDPGQEPD